LKIRPTILNIAGVVQIVYSMVNYFMQGKEGEEEGWGMLATIILVAFGAGAIISDLFLQKIIKDKQKLLVIEIILVIIAWFFIYKY
jgi:uncharacterized membrane protein